MEVREISSVNKTRVPLRPVEQHDVIKVPGDYLLGPFFAATKQKIPREVKIRTRTYQIGGWDPLLRIQDFSPAFDVRHARALFTALSFRNPFDSSPEIHFSLNQFCQRYANSNSGRYSRDIIKLFVDLKSTYIRVTDSETGYLEQYRFFENILHYNRPPRRRDSALARSPQLELGIDGITLSNEFLNVLSGRVIELQHLKVRVLNSIRSPLAQAIYLYIPSRAHHHKADDPFKISLTLLLQQVGWPKIPRYKSLRKQIFTCHEDEGRSVMQQLDKAETLSGRFRVALAETADGSDWQLHAWEEPSEHKKSLASSESKLVAAYRASGRPLEWLQEALALSKFTELSEHEIYLLEKAEVDISRCEPFLKQTKAILREHHFVDVLGECKSDALEGRKAKKSPTARLIDRLMRTVKTPPSRPTFKGR